MTNSHWRELGGSPFATRMCGPYCSGDLHIIALRSLILSFLCGSGGRGVQGPDPSFSPVHPQDLPCAWNMAGVYYYLSNEA